MVFLINLFELNLINHIHINRQRLMHRTALNNLCKSLALCFIEF